MYKDGIRYGVVWLEVFEALVAGCVVAGMAILIASALLGMGVMQ
jgi:hypothetical protein